MALLRTLAIARAIPARQLSRSFARHRRSTEPMSPAVAIAAPSEEVQLQPSALPASEWELRERELHQSARAMRDAGGQKLVLHAAIIGAPNAGKSQLQFCLSRSHVPVSAVSAKANTTRRAVIAIDSDLPSGTQLIYHDTPGFSYSGGTGAARGGAGAGRRVDRDVATGAGSTLALGGPDGEVVDVALLVVDVLRGYDDGSRAEASLLRIIETTASIGAPTVLVLNKVDRMRNKRAMLPLAEKLLGWIRTAESRHGVRSIVGCGARLRLSRGEDGDADGDGDGDGDGDADGNGRGSEDDLVFDFIVDPDCNDVNDTDRAGDGAGQDQDSSALADLGLLDVYFVSAAKGDGVNDLRDGLLAAASDPALADRCSVRQWPHDEGVLSDLPLLDHAEELIREKLFVRLQQELPYQIVQRTLGWTELADGSLRIDHELRVPRKSQRNLLLGKGSHKGSRPGSTGVDHTRAIAAAAVPALQHLVGRPVQLHLTVKVDRKAGFQ